jgi:hypothetical protein
VHDVSVDRQLRHLQGRHGILKALAGRLHREGAFPHSQQFPLRYESAAIPRREQCARHRGHRHKGSDQDPPGEGYHERHDHHPGISGCGGNPAQAAGLHHGQGGGESDLQGEIYGKAVSRPGGQWPSVRRGQIRRGGLRKGPPGAQALAGEGTERRRASGGAAGFRGKGQYRPLPGGEGLRGDGLSGFHFRGRDHRVES